MSTATSNSAKEYHHAHHFPSARAEAEAGKLGMWIFLATEILLFSGLFCAYACYRYTHAEMFKAAHQFLDWKLGAVNTMVLIFSSLTMALAVRATQLGKRSHTIGLLAVTLLCGGAFLVVKYFEYSHKIHMGTLPGAYWHLNVEHYPETAPLQAPDAQGQTPWVFFGIYFLMTGLHGLHVIIGMVVITWVLVRSINNEFGPKYYFPVELVGLYWHLVDLIWIYLFPLLYLVG